MRAIALLCILSVALASTADSALHPAGDHEPALIERTAEGARAPFKITSATVDADALHAAHKTKYRFENGSPQDNTLIVRRGWNVTFTVVTEPIPADNTVDACIGTDSLSCGSTVVSVDAKRTNWVVRLTIPPTFAVGSTQFSAYVMQAVRGSTSINGQLKLTKKVIVLLNPYNPADDAYVPDPSELADYFENEKGAVWKGSSSDFFWAPWAFDHFSTVILYRTTFIVDKLDEKTRKNPVLLARAVAQAMNTVLEGRWSPPYDDGVLPEQWVSSLDIFKMAVAKGKAKYGQCMVFGCVTTSALRTLGFAARPITGYNFATNGDGDALVTIKWDLDAKGNYFPSPSNTEKMWYFHVWTEVLLRRTDLKSTAPEWNIIDGTWHAGPGSVAKFNALDLKSPYDLPAYNAAVNAKLVWANYNNATKKYDKIIENPLVIGDKFLTKGLDSKCSPKWNDNGSQYTSLCYIDRILDYKKRGAKPPAFFEVAATPRQSPRQQVRASASGSKPQLQGQTKIGSNYAAPDASGNRKVVVGDYELTSFVPKAQIIGHEQTITLKYKYVGAGAPKNPITHLGVSVVLRSYSGETIAAVKSERLATPDPKAGSIKVTLTTADFKKLAAGKQLQASRTFVFSFQAFAKTDLLFFDSRPLAMQPPRLNMLCGSKTVNVGSTVACNIFVTNPFQFELPVKQLEVRVTGQGAPVVQSPSAIAANKRVSFDSVKVKTFKAGKQWFMASLKSDYLPDITGVMEITVVGK